MTFTLTLLLTFFTNINIASEKGNTEEKATPTIEVKTPYRLPGTHDNGLFPLLKKKESIVVPEKEEIVVVKSLPKKIIKRRVISSLETLEIIEYIKSFDWDSTIAIQVFTCESGLNPLAYNPEEWSKARGYTKYSSYGIAQLNRPYDQRYFSWRYNIDIAYKEFYVSRYWQPWSCYNSGDYLLPNNQRYLTK